MDSEERSLIDRRRKAGRVQREPADIQSVWLPPAAKRSLFLFLVVSENPTDKKHRHRDDHDGDDDTRRGSHFFY